MLIGERADPDFSRQVTDLAAATAGVEAVNAIVTLHLAPEQVVVNLSLDFADDLTAADIEAAVVDLERRIRDCHPEVSALFVKPQAAAEAARRRETGQAGVVAD